MAATLVVDVFGCLAPRPERVAPDPEMLGPQDWGWYLWSIFSSRSEHMGWSVREKRGASGLWSVEEAAVTLHDEQTRIGFAQVGLEVNRASIHIDDSPVFLEGPPPGVDLSDAGWAAFPSPVDAGSTTDPAVAITPLIQCVDDSLRWFGETEVSAYQVTGTDLQLGRRSHPYRLASVFDWYSIESGVRKQAAITMAVWPRGELSLASEVAARIYQTNTGPFEIGLQVSGPEEYAAGPDWGWIPWYRDDTQVEVSLPEWSPAAAGWMIAKVFDIALSLESPPRDLSVRVTRTAPE